MNKERLSMWLLFVGFLLALVWAYACLHMAIYAPGPEHHAALRKLHLVRPDLIQYPIDWRVYA